MTLVRATVALAIASASAVLGPAAWGHAQDVDSDAPVVRNRPVSEAPEVWTVDAEPVLEIGGSPADPKQQLYQVVTAARLDDGRIVIASAGSHELRVYDPEGGHLGDVGGEGEGPGEFRSFSSVQVGPRDSIYVYDRDLQRVTVFSPQGELERTSPIRAAQPPPAELRRFRDGRWYAVDGDRIVRGPAGTIRRDTASFLLLGSDLSVRSRMTALPGMMTASGEGGKMYRGAPFTPLPVYDELGSCLYVTSGDSFALRVLSSDGRVVRRVRNAGERRAASSEEFSAWIDRTIEEQAITNPKKRKFARRVLRKLPRPDSLPVYHDLVVDGDGRIWLQRYTPPSGVGRGWVVLGPRGELLGRVRMPAAVEVFDVGDDWVLAGWKDAVGREYVRLYQLERDAPAPPYSPPGRCTPAGW